MPELRKDPITGRWVIISSERGKRPVEFQDQRTKKRGGFCPFCGGNERTTPNETLAYRTNGQPNGPDWRLRAVPNKFPALQIEGGLNKQGEGIFDKMNGIGAHEVIIESPDHNATLATLPQKAVEEVLWAYRDRMEDLKKDTRFQYTLIFKNEGLAAGATLEHSHSQLIALPIVPIQVQEELDGCRRHYDLKERCIFCDIIRQEVQSGIRVVLESQRFIALAPYAPRFPFETWIMPKQHLSCYSCSTNDDYQRPGGAPAGCAAAHRPGIVLSALQLHHPHLPLQGREQRLLPLAYRAYAQAQERGGFRMGIGLLHQSHPS